MKKVINDYEMNKRVADKIISAIESGDVASWRKFWTCSRDEKDLYYRVIDGEASAMMFTQQELRLTLYGVDIPAGFYATYKQLRARKLYLNKNAKGYPTYKRACFDKLLTKLEEEKLKELREENEELNEQLTKLENGEIKTFVLEFTYTDDKDRERTFNEVVKFKRGKITYEKVLWVLEYLFNNNDLREPVDVKELWDVKERITKKEVDIIKTAEKVKNSYIERGKVDYQEIYQDRAFYRPCNHSVRMPLKSEFAQSEEYYQVMFHELSHSTGHHSLLNRASLTGNAGFGSASYSKEELVAELSSLYILTALNICTETILKNSIAYIKSWGENFGKSIKHNIINTIENSRKASNLILGIA